MCVHHESAPRTSVRPEFDRIGPKYFPDRFRSTSILKYFNEPLHVDIVQTETKRRKQMSEEYFEQRLKTIEEKKED